MMVKLTIYKSDKTSTLYGQVLAKDNSNNTWTADVYDWELYEFNIGVTFYYITWSCLRKLLQLPYGPSSFTWKKISDGTESKTIQK